MMKSGTVIIKNNISNRGLAICGSIFLAISLFNSIALGQSPPPPTTTSASTAPPPLQPDACANVSLTFKSNSSKYDSCLICVSTNYKLNVTTNGTCVFTTSTKAQPNFECSTSASEESQFINDSAFNKKNCMDKFGGDNTTTTTTPSPPPTTNGTVPTTTPSTPTNGSTTTGSTTTTASPSTTTSSPITPNGTSTTGAPPSPGNITTELPPTPTPQPSSSGGFSFATFLGGIVFTLAVSSLAYVVWRFYKARLERNYHTLNTNLI